MTLDSKENSRDPLYVEVKLTEVFATFREKLVTILNGGSVAFPSLSVTGGLSKSAVTPSEILITSRWRSGLAKTTSN